VITIVDTTAPVLIMPEQTFIHITCTAVNYGILLNFVNGNLNNNSAIQYQNFLANIFMVNGLVPTGAVDNCSNATVSETGIQIITDVECPEKARIRCIFVATDACGNVSEPQFTELIVIDQTTPHIFCPADIVVACGSDTSPAVTGFATATDNCSGPMNISYYDTSVSNFCPTSFVRVWVATDGCGNVATCEQLITLVENTGCSTAPTGLTATAVGPNTVTFSWNAIPGTIGCRVIARAQGQTINVGTVTGNAPSSLTVSSPFLVNGRKFQWRVVCACSSNPLVTTPLSPWKNFTFNFDPNKANTGDAGKEEFASSVNLEAGVVYPNPTRGNAFLSTTLHEGDLIIVRDISGMTVASTVAPAEGAMMEIDMSKYAAGVYFIQHIGRSGVPHVYKVIKN
jgi:hypothetical protein